jgi:hypothetical protein
LHIENNKLRILNLISIERHARFMLEYEIRNLV